MTMPRALMAVLAVATLAGCTGDGDRALTEFRGTRDGPDEFAVLPSKPLETPESFAALPAPTPGGANRTDQNPLGDSIAALGGNPAALNAGSVPASDGGIVTYASRFGVPADVRATVRAEDDRFRRGKWRLNRWKIDKRDLYNDVYKQSWLNAYAELERLRRLGVTTPTAPPGQR